MFRKTEKTMIWRLQNRNIEYILTQEKKWLKNIRIMVNNEQNNLFLYFIYLKDEFHYPKSSMI